MCVTLKVRTKLMFVSRMLDSNASDHNGYQWEASVSEGSVSARSGSALCTVPVHSLSTAAAVDAV